MTDRENVTKGLTELAEYLSAKMDIAGVGKGKEVFGSWYRSVEDALALLKEQDKQIDDLKAELAKTEDNFSEYAEMMQDTREPVAPEWRLGIPFCGKCGRQLRGFFYCPDCGRAVKWD